MYEQYRIFMKGITKKYPGVYALRNFDFGLIPGEVHCLCGENGSGKSTFIKILSGVERAEPGSEIWIDGVRYAHHSSAQALASGIQVIYQDMSLFPNLTVRENIAFAKLYSSRGFVDRKKADTIAHNALADIGVSMDLDKKVESLSVAQQQLVEISRALTGSLKLLVLDEPTSSLTRREVNALFHAIELLKSKGIAILFVSHKLNEVFQIAERITVIRDGVKIGVFDPSELDHDKLVYHMTGHVQNKEPPAPVSTERPIALEVRGLCRRGNYKDVSFALRKGEILGITGLLGSGRTELALSLFGMTSPDSGKMLIDGKAVRFKSNVEAIAAGIGYVSENRRDIGLVLDQPIVDNLTITVLATFLNKLHFLSEKKRRLLSESCSKRFGVKTATLDAPVTTLSGGNQQKVVLAKWLNVSPKILILDEPTTGIDVVAKNGIYSLIKGLAEEGIGIVLISDEVSEVMRNCHRVLVMRGGRIVHEFRPAEETEEKLLEQFNLA